MDQILHVGTLLPTLILLIAVFMIKSKSNLFFLIRLAEFTLAMSAIIAFTELCLLFGNQIYSTTFGIQQLGFLFRIDQLSTAMLFMVSIIGFVVTRYSRSYLMGDKNQLVFIRRLITTIVLVQFLMMAGSLITLVLFWSATSISLHYLLIFYKNRKTARYSARKKFIVARASDVTLLAASILLFHEFDTVNLELIFEQLQIANANSNTVIAGVLIVIAAVFKSAQVPFHGWLLEVMEAPTPVSGLLHAGLLNAGPFLILRFAYLMELSSVGSTLLIVIGGITALYGTIVFPTQPAIKTSLAYSSVAHMGFSLMTCGMGIYSAALLHLMAHSFYKAHSFLSSGSLIEKYRHFKLRKANEKKISVGIIIFGLILTGSLYIAFIQMWGGLQNQNIQMFLLGSIIVVGVSIFSINVLSYRNLRSMLLSSVTLCSLILMSFFFLEHFFMAVIEGNIPKPSELSPNQLSISVVILVLFVGIGISTLAENIGTPSTSKWKIYRRNGFYLHNLLDRLLKVNGPNILKK